VSDHDDERTDAEPTAERAARGVVTAWILAKTTPWLVRLTLWAAWLAAAGAYAGYVWWRVRRMMRSQGVPNLAAWLHPPDAPR
jgi:hypothetical protein